VAALEREVWPLVKKWNFSSRQHQGRQFKFFENAGTVLVCGGIGADAARRATEAVIRLYHPASVISVGFAGALQTGIKVGQPLMPRWVVNARDGSRSDTETGDGVLVTADAVVGVAQKKRLAEAYGAQAVDMEGAAVARGAETHGIRFAALKVISDAFEFEMPPLQRFVLDGKFHAARFGFYAAARPWLWKSVLQLARNSARASKALCRILAQDDFFESTFSLTASNGRTT
jgi:adenosylhomocysteine nucleosidase